MISDQKGSTNMEDNSKPPAKNTLKVENTEEHKYVASRSLGIL